MKKGEAGSLRRDSLSVTNLIDHNCTIAPRRDELRQFIPGDRTIDRIHRRFKEMCIVSPEFPMARANLKSGRAFQLEIRRHLHFDYYMIHPFSDFRGMWEGIMILINSTKLVIVPFVVTYLPHIQHSIFHNPVMLCVLMFDLFGLIDIIASFNTGYYCYSKKEMILNRRRSTIYYLKRMFFFDLISSVPLEIFLLLPEPQSEEGEFVLSPFIIFSMLKVFHVYTIFMYLRRLQERFDTMTFASKLFRQFFALLFAIHWVSCLKFLVTRYVRGDIEDYVPSSSWTQNMRFLMHAPHDRYIISLYNTICACTTYSYGIAQSYAQEDMIISIFLHIFGSMLKIIVASQVLLLIRNTSASKLKYQTVLQQLKEFMRYKQLPATIRNRLLDYYEYRFQKNFYKENEILSTLSTQLRQDIVLYSCRRLVASVPFFYNIPNSLLVRIVTSLRSEIFLPRDNVVIAGQPGRCMYLIGSGTVAVYSPTGAELAHLSDGAHFGEVVLVTDDNLRSATVVAIETCELFVLEREDFLNAIEPFPEIMERMRDEARHRLNVKTSVRNAPSDHKSA